MRSMWLGFPLIGLLVGVTAFADGKRDDDQKGGDDAQWVKEVQEAATTGKPLDAAKCKEIKGKMAKAQEKMKQQASKLTDEQKKKLEAIKAKLAAKQRKIADALAKACP